MPETDDANPSPGRRGKTLVRLVRTVAIPDPDRLARMRRAPELGPSVLFFSGGSALRGLCPALIRHTHNSVHLITPFDSGGSSAVLRRAFGMPAVGDMRNRLMSLADRSLTGNPAVYDLFARRLSRHDGLEAAAEFAAMLAGEHPLVQAVTGPMRRIISRHLAYFRHAMPDDFDLRGASVGNLILAGGYFNFGRKLDPVLSLFSKLVEAKGVVRPIVDRDLTLAARLRDGTLLLGQHLLTGKEVPAIASPVDTVFLCASPEDPSPVRPAISRWTGERIRSAQVICYPVGSFYSSLVATLLPRGVGRAVARAGCPKVYVPNTVGDPEQLGLGLADQVRVLADHLLADLPGSGRITDVIGVVLVDLRNGRYPKPLALRAIRRMGVEVLDVPLVTPSSAPFLDPEATVACLLSFAP